MSGDLSVIMPMYNCEQWVEEAVRSVVERAEGLRELIVIDDGSTDRSAEIVRSIDGPIEVIQQANAGPSAARNAGLRVARGELIGFLDADDIWTADAPDLRRVELANGADCAIGKVQLFIGEPPRDFRDPTLVVLLPTMLVSRALVEKVGEFDESMTHGEDTDWLMRLRESGAKLAYSDQVVFRYRLFRSGSLTCDRDANHGAMTKVLRMSLVRRGIMKGDGA